MGKERNIQWFSVQQNRLNVLIGLRVVVGTDNESLAVGQINRHLLKQRTSDRINRLAGTYLIEAHGVQNIPCRHLTAIFITRQAVRSIEILVMQHTEIGRASCRERV